MKAHEGFKLEYPRHADFALVTVPSRGIQSVCIPRKDRSLWPLCAVGIAEHLKVHFGSTTRYSTLMAVAKRIEAMVS